MPLRERVRAWLARVLLNTNTNGFIQENNERFIHDDVDWTLPVTMPEHLERRLQGSGQLKQYIESVSDQSYRFQFDNPQRSAADLPVMPTTEDPLREWNYATRKQVLSTCHSAYHRNPLLNTAGQYTADFVIGEGFNLVCKNKRVERLLQAFIDNPENAIREWEREALIDLQMDGELFIRYFVGEGDSKGQIIAVPLRPWECEWIKTEPGFFRRRISYKFQFYQEPGDSYEGGQKTVVEEIPHEEIQHVAINKSGYELRGRPEFYRVLAWARADSQFLENRARQNHWRSAFLWAIRVKNATSSAVTAVRARYSRPPPPGSVSVEGDNVEVTSVQNAVGGSDAMEDGRAIKNRVIMGLRLPEYFFADGYNANLATAKSQQLPALTKFSAFQTIMIEQVWTPMFKRVIKTAIDEGLIPSIVIEQDSQGEPVCMDADEAEHYTGDIPLGDVQPDGGFIRQCATTDAFEVTYAPLGTEGQLDMAHALEIAVDREWASNQTAAQELGYDTSIESKRIAREKDKQMDDMVQGRRPPAVNMGYNGNDENADDAVDMPPDANVPAEQVKG